jgi:autotransporter-associated beta strand protein
MMFNTGAGTGYTISSPGAQTITLQSTIAANTHIEVVSGNHVINSNIVMAQGDPLINVAVGQKLTLNGVLSNLSGPANITFEGNGDGKSQVPTYGTLELTGLNTFTGPVVMSNYGRLAIDKVGALGQSSVDPANLVINGILAYTGTATTPTTVVMDRGYTVAGVPTANVFNDGFLNEIEVANANINLKITGQVTSPAGLTSAFRKMGPGTLTYANTGTNNVLGGCDFQIGEGTVVFESGTYSKGRDNILFQWGGGHFLVGDPDSTTAGYSPTLKVLNGATVNTGGDLVVAGFGGVNGTFILDAATTNVGAWTIIGQGAGAIGNATVSNGGVLNTAGLLWVGRDGATGNLTMGLNTVATVNNNELYIGAGAGGLGTVTLNDNSRMTVNGWSQIGRDGGNGTLVMKNTSSLTVTNQFRLGRWGATSVGLVQMSGTSTITAGTNAPPEGQEYEGYIGTDGASGTLEMTENSTYTSQKTVQFGRSGGTGTLKMSGASYFDARGQEFRLGVSGGNGVLEMSGTAIVEANSFLRVGRNEDWDAGRGVADVTMTGSSKMICDWDLIGFGTNGGYAKVVMNGDNAADPVLIGNWAGHRGDTWDMYIGADAGSEGLVEMKGYSKIDEGGYTVFVGVNGGKGDVTMQDNAFITAGSELRVGANSGTGTLTIGSTTGTSTISIGAHMRVGYDGGNGTLTIGPGANIGVNQWLQIGNGDTVAAGTGIVNMTGGTITKNANAGSFVLVGRNGTGTWTQSGGLADLRSGVCLGNVGYTGTLNLNGGVFSAGFIQAGYEGDATAIMRINFDGGTLKVNTAAVDAAGSGSNFITPYLSTDAHVYVKHNGAIIDTSGADVAIALALEEDLVSTGGGLKKIGGGALTLAVDPTYTGNTTVNEGTLNVGNLTHSANVYVASTSTLNATSIVTGTLTIGGPALAAASSASVTAVPEPSTIVLLVLAGLGALLAWRRK